MKITGTITEIKEVEKGTTKAGKDWEKINFVVETDEKYNNTYPLEIFGAEKVAKFLEYNKTASKVDVEFNISANKWKEKYFVSLQAWKVSKVKEEEDNKDDLPF